MGIFGRTDDDESLKDSIIELGFASKANWFISPFADLLGRWSDYRINEPGTCSEKNWSVRFLEKDFSDSLALKIKTLTEKYKR
jgi:4-alpha-glucanotransferase